MVLVSACVLPQGGSGCYRNVCQPEANAGSPATGLSVFELSVRGSRQGSHLRLVTNEPVEPYVFTLADDGERLVLDLPRVDWQAKAGRNGAGQREGRGRGVVDRFRFADFSDDVSRLVLDLNQPAIAERERHRQIGRGRYEYTMKIKATSAEHFAQVSGYRGGGRASSRPGVPQATAKSAQSTSTGMAASPGPLVLGGKPATRSSLSSSSVNLAPMDQRDLITGNGDFVVVIDPGHGGRDPGAISASGVMEKNVTLPVALHLRDTLARRSQYTVVMTRNDDRYISLPDRLAWARQNKADLFISIHADSLPAGSGRTVSGASVYTLAKGGQARSRSQVLGEDNWLIGVDLDEQDPDVSEILLVLSQSRTQTASARLSQVVIDELGQIGPLLRNTHRTAKYYVLLAPDVPAVLVEMGFLSNPREAARLNRPDEQRRVADALARAVNTYYADNGGR